MECRAEFVGWSFAFLSDTIVSYVTASQYLDQNIYTPNSILENKYENTWKFYTNPDNPIVDSTETNNPWCKNKVVPERCTTIFDLVKAVKNVLSDANYYTHLLEDATYEMLGMKKPNRKKEVASTEMEEVKKKDNNIFNIKL